MKHVYDSRNHVIRGLWELNGRYYAQLRVPGKRSACKVPLVTDTQEHCRTVAEAVAARNRLLENRRQGKTPGPRITPRFDEYVEHYLNNLTLLQAKASTTIDTERYLLRAWEFGTLRLSQITRKMLLDRRTTRKQEGKVTNKTLNLEVGALRSLFKHAVSEGYLKEETLPTDIKGLPYKSPKRELLDEGAVDRVCAEAVRTAIPEAPKSMFLRQIMAQYRAEDQTVNWEQAFTDHPEWREQLGATSHQGLHRLYVRAHYLQHHSMTGQNVPVPVYRNGQMFADWIRFMAYSGARNAAARRAEWTHVDWKNGQIHLFTKRNKEVIEPFNDRLAAHLKEMQTRRVPGASGALSPYLFPSPRLDGPMRTFGKTLRTIRQKLGLPKFTAHYLRHYFISMAVMAGIDYMTIAEIVGHSDGGILIAKTYGHLRKGHKEEQLKKLKFDGKAPAPPSNLETQLAELKQMQQQVLQAIQQQQKPAGA